MNNPPTGHIIDARLREIGVLLTAAKYALECVEGEKHLKRLCKGIVKEAVDKGYADMWDESWNQKAHVNLTLTIDEIRVAASFINYHPTAEDIRKSDEANDWEDYINELDGVE